MTVALSLAERKLLIRAAFEAKEYAYSPYSKFPVGAALLTDEGEVIKGANVDNASYGGSICAERTAIVKAVSEGKRSFIGLALTSGVCAIITPCGICRQVIREFCAPDMPILLVPGDYYRKVTAQGDYDTIEDGVKVATIGTLLPDSFGPEDLELPQVAKNLA